MKKSALRDIELIYHEDVSRSLSLNNQIASIEFTVLGGGLLSASESRLNF